MKVKRTCNFPELNATKGKKVVAKATTFNLKKLPVMDW